MDAAKKLSHRTHLHLVKDYVQTAAAAKLVYVSDAEPGISRLRKGKGFSYMLQDAVLKNKDVRISRDADWNRNFLYSFVDKNTLVIIGNETAFKEILDKLIAAKYVR